MGTRPTRESSVVTSRNCSSPEKSSVTAKYCRTAASSGSTLRLIHDVRKGDEVQFKNPWKKICEDCKAEITDISAETCPFCEADESKEGKLKESFLTGTMDGPPGFGMFIVTEYDDIFPLADL